MNRIKITTCFQKSIPLEYLKVGPLKKLNDYGPTTVLEILD
jgi:hypothetical protein